MDVLRVRLAAKRKLKSRSDILGLVKNANFKKSKSNKKQPTFPQYGIFSNAISFKINSKRNIIDSVRKSNVWTVSKSTTIDASNAEHIEHEQSKIDLDAFG